MGQPGVHDVRAPPSEDGDEPGHGPEVGDPSSDVQGLDRDTEAANLASDLALRQEAHDQRTKTLLVERPDEAGEHELAAGPVEPVDDVGDPNLTHCPG